MINGAQLVTLEGDDSNTCKPVKLRQYLAARMDKKDYGLLMGSDSITKAHINYLDTKYPDLMGVWPAIAKILGKVGSLVGRGIKAAKAAKARRNASKAQAQQQQQQRANVAAAISQQEAEKKKKNTMIVAGAVGAGILLLMLTSKKKTK